MTSCEKEKALPPVSKLCKCHSKNTRKYVKFWVKIGLLWLCLPATTPVSVWMHGWSTRGRPAAATLCCCCVLPRKFTVSGCDEKSFLSSLFSKGTFDIWNLVLRNNSLHTHTEMVNNIRRCIQKYPVYELELRVTFWNSLVVPKKIILNRTRMFLCGANYPRGSVLCFIYEFHSIGNVVYV